LPRRGVDYLPVCGHAATRQPTLSGGERGPMTVPTPG